MNIVIPIEPKTKKNSQQIIVNRSTGRPMLIQSKEYIAYEKECMRYIGGEYRQQINRPVNIKALFYRKTHRRVDITNLNSALHDVLVRAGVLADDNANIVVSTDGSRVRYDKEHPRTEIEITEVTE